MCGAPAGNHAFCGDAAQSMLRLSRADTMVKALRAQNVTTLGHALSVIYDWGLTLSEHDMDLI